jgi:hypothetical protein
MTAINRKVLDISHHNNVTSWADVQISWLARLGMPRRLPLSG